MVQLSKTHKYFLVFSLIALTAFEFFFRADYLVLPLFLYSGWLFLTRKNHFQIQALLIISPFFLISILQSAALGVNYRVPFILLVGLFTYYIISCLLKEEFFKYYIKILLIISLVSLVFYFLSFSDSFMSVINNSIAPYFKSLNKEVSGNKAGGNILIYNFLEYYSLFNRNSGPFWEPGMFAVFLNIALFYNLIASRRFLGITNIVLFVTILTTFSTAGYLGLFFSLITYLIFFFKNRLKFILIPFLVICVFYSFQYLDFLQNKILDQFQVYKNQDYNRFGAAFVHLKILREYPMLGIGKNSGEIISHFTDSKVLANGITNLFIVYGIPIGILYYILLLMSCIRIMALYTNKKIIGVCFFLLLLILAFAQDITTRHFYYFLIFVGILQYNKGLKYYKI